MNLLGAALKALPMTEQVEDFAVWYQPLFAR
jgi:hypothetical protein